MGIVYKPLFWEWKNLREGVGFWGVREVGQNGNGDSRGFKDDV